jgi:hypothetical protein
MAAQAHFNVEAHNLEVLNFNFRHWNHVKFPNPIYATSAVIIKTFESGQIITTILDKFDALATQIALEQGTLDCRGGRRMQMAHRVHDLHAFESTRKNVVKFIVSTGLSLYLKMLLIGKSTCLVVSGIQKILANWYSKTPIYRLAFST